MNNRLEEYILSHIDPEPELLKEIDREVHVKLLHASMMSGHLQGRLLKMLTRMIRPERVLEIGCSHGGFLQYCLSHGIRKATGIEIDENTCRLGKWLIMSKA